MEKKTLENSLDLTIGEWLYYHQENLHFKQKYRDLKMKKNPFDLVIYEEIIWEIKPNVIVEIGSAFGGFTLWLLDRMRIARIKDPRVITIDLTEIGNSNLKASKEERVTSLVGDCNSDEVIKKVKEQISKKDKVMIIEDSSHTYENTLSVLDNYKEFVSKGSYFVIEDGICDVLDLPISPGPMKAVESWIKKNPQYEIDRERERYIMTYNPKGYLKRIK